VIGLAGFAFHLGFELVVAEAVTSPVHVEFANNVAGSDVMRQTLDGHWTAKQAVEHQLELGHILTLNADNL